MKNSLQRVRQVLAHERPDRTPVFDLIPNDVVLRYFNNGLPVAIGDDAASISALQQATDATRWSYLSPMTERTERLSNGREERYGRWTIWTSHRPFASSAEYAMVKRHELSDAWQKFDEPLQVCEDERYQRDCHIQRQFGEDYAFVLSGPSPGLMAIYEEVGLEAFSYYLADCEEIIIEQLELQTVQACAWATGLPTTDPFDIIFLGEDIAFKNGPMVNPAWLAREYFPRLRQVIDAMHARGKKVMFHSDGNINPIMDGLVEAGIDLLNPIEVAAGMDLADLHRRYPGLIFAGGIDVTQLLPFGTPQQVCDAVEKAIEDTEGQILVGSSTEVLDIVPLANYLAMRETAMSYRR